MGEHEREEQSPTQPATERVTKESIGEGEPGGAEYVAGEDAVDQSESADERL